MNFGSQTFSASCFDVTGAVAPRAKREVIDGHSVAFAVVHHVQPPRMLAARARLAAFAATGLSNSHTGPPFGYETLRWCSSTNPVEDVCGMKPPSSDAEALRDQQTAQVRATNRLLVAADELRDLERGHQPIRQSVGRGRRLRQRLAPSSQYAPIPCTSSSSSVPPHICGVERVIRRLALGMSEPSRNGAAEDDRPKAIDSRGGLGEAGFRTRRSTRARIVAGPESDARADVRGASNSERPCRASSRTEKPHATVHDGIDGPSVVRLNVAGNVPAALRSRLRVALSAVAVGLNPSAFRLRPFQPFRSRCFLPRTYGAGSLEALHVTDSRRGGVAINRHT